MVATVKSEEKEAKKNRHHDSVYRRNSLCVLIGTHQIQQYTNTTSIIINDG